MELNKEKNKTTISVNLKRRQGTDNNRFVPASDLPP